MIGLKERIKYLFFIFLIIFLAPSLVRTEPLLTIVFLDVGEGESIYIDTPTNEKILVDSGNTITGSRVVDFLKSKGIKTLDAVFITHPHQDHMGGIFHILPNFYIKAIYDNGQAIPDDTDCDIYRWYEEAVRKDNYKPVKAGDVFHYGDIKIHVLWPKSPESPDWNANSLVLKALYGNKSFLFMGDGNTTVERSLLDDKADLKAQVLKVGHHGANDTTGMDFLRAVSPSFAVISINKNNVIGYPSHEVLKRLHKEGIKILTTYNDNNIKFTSNKEGLYYLK